MKVVIAEPIKKELIDLIHENNKDWVVYENFPKDKQEFIRRVKGADIACSYINKFDAEVLSAAPTLKYLVISAVGAGISVDMNFANKNGVTVLNCPGYNAQAVAEIAIGLAIEIGRSISFMNKKMTDGTWSNGEQLNRIQIGGKKIALIGYGNVGQTIHKLLNNWSDDFEIVNSSTDFLDVDVALAKSDIVFVCCTLNKKTKGLIDARRLKLMKKDAIFVNVARGPIVDEDTLYELLKNRSIAGAGLDVFNNEPMPGSELPENIARFTRLDNTVCTPHVAAGTKESGEALSQMIYENIESCINGVPKNVYTN